MAVHFSAADGLCLRVEENGRALQRYLAVEKALNRTLAGWLPRMRDFRTKGYIARHLYLDAKHAQAIAGRLVELLYGRGAFEAPQTLDPFLDIMPRAEGVDEFVAGVYLTVKGRLVQAYRAHLDATDPVFDQPTIDVLEPILRQEEEQVTWARQYLHDLYLPAERKAHLGAWQEFLEGALAAAGGIRGDGPADPYYMPPAPFGERPPYQLPDRMYLDDMPNPSVDSDPGKVPPDYHMIYAYFQEIDIADLLATILYDSPTDMPVGYYVDFSRQCWDEIRHTTMGIRRLQELGFSLADCGAPCGRFPAWRRMTVLERMAWLTQVGEACSLSGKREHIRKYLENGDVISAAQIEYDIADESAHVRFGSRWMPELMKREGDTRSRKDLAADANHRFREELAAIRRAAELEVPENYLDRFQGCEDVRDPALSF